MSVANGFVWKTTHDEGGTFEWAIGKQPDIRRPTAVESIFPSVDGTGSHTVSDVLDALIVGCGPAGLAASLHCLDRRLRFVTLEREDIGGSVRYYPRKKLVLTSPLSIPGYGKISHREML